MGVRAINEFDGVFTCDGANCSVTSDEDDLITVGEEEYCEDCLCDVAADALHEYLNLKGKTITYSSVTHDNGALKHFDIEYVDSEGVYAEFNIPSKLLARLIREDNERKKARVTGKVK